MLIGVSTFCLYLSIVLNGRLVPLVGQTRRRRQSCAYRLSACCTAAARADHIGYDGSKSKCRLPGGKAPHPSSRSLPS